MEVEGIRSFAAVFADSVVRALFDSLPVAIVPAVVPKGAVTASTGAVELVSILMPARPASLIPAAGAGLGKLAEGVTRMGPPKGSLTGAGLVYGFVDWPCPKTAVEITIAAVKRILRGMVHPWVIDHPWVLDYLKINRGCQLLRMDGFNCR
jgi:hypothetical protein